MEDEIAQQVIEKVDEQDQHIKGVIESLLFVNERPVTLEQIKKVLDAISNTDIKKAISQLQDDYEERKSGVTIVEIAGGYQMLSNSIYASYLRSFYKTKHKEKLSKPALESMAIIAYKQPVTRSNIELIRGVNSDGVVGHLLNKELIKVVGRKDVPGRPYVYGTTKQFLEYFGLKSLDDLPKLEEFPALVPADEAPIIELSDEEKQEQEKEGQSQEQTENDVSESPEDEAGDVDNQEATESCEETVSEQNEDVVEARDTSRLNDDDFIEVDDSPEKPRISAEGHGEQEPEENQEQQEWNQENESEKSS